MPGALYFLSMAADAFGTRVASALGGSRIIEIKAGTQDVPAGEGIFLRRRYIQYSQGPRARIVQGIQAGGVPVVVHRAGAQRLRDAEGDGGCRGASADRGLRIGRPADSEEHQEGRDDRDGAHVRAELQESG